MAMLGMTELEKKHPKLMIGVSGAVVLSVLIMGGQLTLNYGRTLERMDTIEREADRRREAHTGFVTRDEYRANNEAVLRELQRTNEALRDMNRAIERLSRPAQ